MEPLQLFRAKRLTLAVALLPILFLATMCSAAPPRQMIALSGPVWQFAGAGDAETLPDFGTPAYAAQNWTSVSVPHDFQTRTNMEFAQGWYQRRVAVSSALSTKRLYLVFEGAAAIADVYVNGQHLGQHRGAYTRFIFDATTALHVGNDNVVAVRVDNRQSSTTDCLPSVRGLYTVWGGLYRNVWLLATNNLSIDPTYYASPGVFITPSLPTLSSGNISIKVLLRNTFNKDISADVEALVEDPTGKVVTTVQAISTVPANGTTTANLNGVVDSPLLWTPETPHLYHVQVNVSANKVLADSVTQPLGFHQVSWSLPAGTLTLNGKPYVLYGADLHQEIESKQSAVAPEDLIANIDSLKDVGANFVRFAHYPRATLEYDQCDERGIFCWAENGHSHNDLAGPTADLITTELVEQNYNHPSIIFWSVGNEGQAAPAEREVPVVKALDTSRLVVVAAMGCDNADVRTQNTYPGWYGGGLATFQPHGIISEIGAGGVVGTHCDYGATHYTVDSYEPEEYQQLVAETEFEDAFDHNDGRLGAFTWWCMRDFNDVKYKHTVAPLGHGINSKGLETYAGYKKDIYYLYRSFLRPDVTTLHITSKEYFLRHGAANNGIKVYSNAKSVTLSLNGSKVSTLQNDAYSQSLLNSSYNPQIVRNVFYWPVALAFGKNVVTVTDGLGNSDRAVIYYYGQAAPQQPSPGPLLTSLTSSNPANQAFYIDDPVHAEWPVYYDLDSSADNTLDTIPAPAAGAGWVALGRVTKPGFATTVSLTAAQPITVYVIATKEPSEPTDLLAAGFKPLATAPFQWRGNDLILVDAELFAQHLTAGQKAAIPLGDRDALVLVKGD